MSIESASLSQSPRCCLKLRSCCFCGWLAMPQIEEDGYDRELAALEGKKKRAMADENFEECARIRDQINELKSSFEEQAQGDLAAGPPASLASETEELMRSQEEQFDAQRGFSKTRGGGVGGGQPAGAKAGAGAAKYGGGGGSKDYPARPVRKGKPACAQCPCLFEWDTLLIILLAVVLISFLGLDIWAQIVRPAPLRASASPPL